VPKTCDHTGLDRIDGIREDYRDCRGGLLDGKGRRRRYDDNKIDLKANQVGRELGETLAMTF